MDERDVIKQKLSTYSRLRQLRLIAYLVLGEHYTYDVHGNRLYNDVGIQLIIKDSPKRGRPKKCQ